MRLSIGVTICSRPWSNDSSSGSRQHPIPRITAQTRYVGALGPSASLPLTFVLPLRRRAELNALIASQQNRHSPQYHRWLTPQSFAQAFGPEPGTLSALTTALQMHRLHVTKITPNGIVSAVGQAGDTDATFTTRHGVFTQAGRPYYANLTTAIIPADLRSLGVSVLGLDNFPRFRTMSMRGSAHAHPDGASGPDGGFTPSDLAAVYDFPSLGDYQGRPNPAQDGTGATIGIIMENAPNPNDVSSFWSRFNVPYKGALYAAAIDGGGSFDPTNSLEVTLDVQQSTALAPGAKEVVYTIPDLSVQHIYDAFNYAVSSNVADVISFSAGGCDPGNAYLDQLFAEGVSQGQTFVASSGDSGSSCLGQNGTVAANYPAASSYVVAVGGTSLTTNSAGTRQSETAWSGSGAAFLSSSCRHGRIGWAATCAPGKRATCLTSRRTPTRTPGSRKS